MNFATSSCFGQVQDAKFVKSYYTELNVGLAKTYEYVDYGLGFSFLRGETYIFKNNFFFDWEIGLAFPTVATGKLGVGLRKNKIDYSIGLRPYPFTTYFQIGSAPSKNGNWVVSFEYNPREEFTIFSGLSNGNINFGYRFFRK